jgi:hypothetical protein
VDAHNFWGPDGRDEAAKHGWPLGGLRNSGGLGRSSEEILRITKRQSSRQLEQKEMGKHLDLASILNHVRRPVLVELYF